MRGFYESNFPFEGHFGPRFGPMGSPPFAFQFPGDFPGHHDRRGCGPFGRHGFDHGPEHHQHDHSGPHRHRRGPAEDGHCRRRCRRHASSDSDNEGPAERHEHGHPGPHCHRRGPAEDGHRGPRCRRNASSDSDNEGPADRHPHGPHDSRGGPAGRHHEHGPSCHSCGPRPCSGQGPGRPCFGRRGPFDRPWRGPWEGPWGHHPMHGFGHFGHRRPCPYNSDERPSRKGDCEKCRENEPCCSGNKEFGRRCGGRKEKEPCLNKDKDQNTNADTEFVQRIILEKTTQPQSD